MRVSSIGVFVLALAGAVQDVSPGIVRQTSTHNLAATARVDAVTYCADLPDLDHDYATLNLTVQVTNRGSDGVAVVKPGLTLVRSRWAVLGVDGQGFRLNQEGRFVVPFEPEPKPSRSEVVVLQPGQSHDFERFDHLSIWRPGKTSDIAAPDGEGLLTVTVAYFYFPSDWLEAWQEVVPDRVPIATGHTEVSVPFTLRRPDVLKECQ